MYRIRNTKKQNILVQSGQKIFSTDDLALLWDIENRNTLLKTVQRYIDRQILFSIYKGIYSIIPIEKLNPFEIACSIGGPFSYISGETILSMEGYILQDVRKLTLFGKKAKEVTIGDTIFLCRYLNNKFLLNRVGIEDNRGFSIATPQRALADLLYLNPQFHIDNQLSINMTDVNNLIDEIGYNDNFK
jgi:predicted transcriptional regulator of viral defense system